MYRILITGATGSIGSRLIEYFLLKNIFYIIATTRSNYVKSFNENLEYVVINEESTFDYSIVCNKVDFIIHLAATNAKVSLDDPINAFNVNCISTGKLFKAAIESKASKFIYFSTAQVYGNPNGLVDENSTLGGTNPYATSHRAAEDLIKSFQDTSNLQTIILRLSNSFGLTSSKNNENLVIHDLAKQAVFEGTLTIKSELNSTRNFITLTDVCESIMHLLFLKFDSKIETFNLGGGKSFTLYQIALVIRDRAKLKLNSDIDIVYNKNTFDISSKTSFNYSIDKIHNLKLKLNSNIDEEIDILLNHYQNLKINESKI
jgi:UDP-glucose 4-epimerase